MAIEMPDPKAFVRSRVFALLSLISKHGRQCGMSGIIQPTRRDLSEVAGTDANEGRVCNGFRRELK